jgi:hypothetical protein
MIAIPASLFVAWKFAGMKQDETRKVGRGYAREASAPRFVTLI